MTSDLAPDLPRLLHRLRALDTRDLEGLGACRIAEMRSGGTDLEAARVRASRVIDYEAFRVTRAEVERLALGLLTGPAWGSDALLYARRDFLIGPALEALDDTVLATVSGDRLDEAGCRLLTAAWREATGASGERVRPAGSVD